MYSPAGAKTTDKIQRRIGDVTVGVVPSNDLAGDVTVGASSPANLAGDVSIGVASPVDAGVVTYGVATSADLCL